MMDNKPHKGKYKIWKVLTASQSFS